MKLFAALMIALTCLFGLSGTAQAYDGCAYPQDRHIVIQWDTTSKVWRTTGSAVALRWADGLVTRSSATIHTYRFGHAVHQVWAKQGTRGWYSGTINRRVFYRGWFYKNGYLTQITRYEACVGPSPTIY